MNFVSKGSDNCRGSYTEDLCLVNPSLGTQLPVDRPNRLLEALPYNAFKMKLGSISQLFPAPHSVRDKQLEVTKKHKPNDDAKYQVPSIKFEMQSVSHSYQQFTAVNSICNGHCRSYY